MNGELNEKLCALREAENIGCRGAHKNELGIWMPCSSAKSLLSLVEPMSVKGRVSLEEISDWNSRRKAKGKKRRKNWEKLRERRVLGISNIQGGGLVSDNGPPGPVVTAFGGGKIPGMFNGNPNPPNMPGGLATKSIQAAYMPRENDPDVFTDIESARKRAQQIGCIGVSRRLAKGGKTVWMPCTNMTDYNNLVGMTPLGRINQEKRNVSAVRTVLKNELKKRKKSISEEILGKALGSTIGRVGRAVSARFDPNAVDADADMLVQEGTPFERPGIPNIPKPKTPSPRGLRSSRDRTPSTPKTTDEYENLGGKKMGEIIRGRVKPQFKNKKPEERTTYIIGGNTGAGKNTVLEKHLVPNGLVPGPEEAATIDPDFIKRGLVGYDNGRGAIRVHGASQKATDHTIRDAADDGSDIVLLGTGTSRQRSHITTADMRGEKVVGHFVHVPASEAAKRMRARGRAIDDNTERLAQSIPRMVAETINDGSMQEFYLWDNSGDEGSTPKLIASFKDGKLDVHDEKKYGEFMRGHKIENRKPSKTENVGGLRSGKLSAPEALEYLQEIGIDVSWNNGNNQLRLSHISLPMVRKFWETYVKPLMPEDNRHGRTNHHKSILDGEGRVFMEDMQRDLGITIDKRKIALKEYRKRMKRILNDPTFEELLELFALAPIDATLAGVPGAARFKDVARSIDFQEWPGGTNLRLQEIARKFNVSPEILQQLIAEKYTLDEISEMTPEELAFIIQLL